jgi:hypothetical protein
MKSVRSSFPTVVSDLPPVQTVVGRELVKNEYVQFQTQPPPKHDYWTLGLVSSDSQVLTFDPRTNELEITDQGNASDIAFRRHDNPAIVTHEGELLRGSEFLESGLKDIVETCATATGEVGLALAVDGSSFAWGKNWQGLLGRGDHPRCEVAPQNGARALLRF